MSNSQEERTDILIDRYQMGDLDDQNIGELIDGLLARLEWAIPKAHAYDSDIRNQKRNELRDEFAAKAMASLCLLHDGNLPETGSAQAYTWADAMLQARGEPK